MSNTLKNIWNVLSTVLVVLMVLCAVFLMGSRLLGYECYNVISPSMAPKYNVGDLLYVKAVDPSTIQVGDVITFVLNEDLVIGTHRVVRVDAENQHLYTKGDANDVEDQSPVHYNNVIGVPQFHIPKLGYVSDFVQNPPGTYITLAIGVLLIAIVFLPDLFAKKKQEEQETAEAEAVQAQIDSAAEENEKLKAELAKLREEMNAKKGE